MAVKNHGKNRQNHGAFFKTGKIMVKSWHLVVLLTTFKFTN